MAKSDILVIVSARVLVAVCGVVAKEEEHVLTLDHSNLTDIVSKHNFIVHNFYAPACGPCESLAPEYKRATFELSSHDPPKVLGKTDGSDDANREVAEQYGIKGPSIKIMPDGGKKVQNYNGPREAAGIVAYLKKQIGPASPEIKSKEDAANLIDEQKIFVIQENLISTGYVKTGEQQADLFTKALNETRVDYLCNKLGMINICAPA